MQVQLKPRQRLGVQMIEAPSALTTKSSSINIATLVSKENQENTMSMIRENQATQTPYRHPNHKSRYLNQT
jgi:hypothetical protein